MRQTPLLRQSRPGVQVNTFLHGGISKFCTAVELAMLSSVLSSERAIEVSIAIMRAFVKLRQLVASNEELNRKFAAVLRKLATHDRYFSVVFDELNKLNGPPVPSPKQIGFKTSARLSQSPRGGDRCAD